VPVAIDARPEPPGGVDSRPGLSTRAYVWWLTGISAVALGVRVDYAVARFADIVAPGLDQWWYQNLATMIVKGRGISSPTAWVDRHVITPTALHGPFTSFLLVPFDYVGYSTLHEHQVMMAVLGTITVVLLAVLAGRLVCREAGVVTALVGAVYPGLWAFDAKVESEPVEQILVAVMLLLAYSFRYKPSAARAVALGSVVGLLVLTRSEQLLTVPLIVIPVCIGALRGHGVNEIAKMTGLAVGMTALVLAPWIAFCETSFQDPEVLSTDLGVGLIQDNNPVTYYSSHIGFWYAPASSKMPPGDESVVDKTFQREATSYARSHLSRVPIVVLARVGRLWDLFHPFQSAQLTAGLVEDKQTQEAWILSFYGLIPFAIVGAVVLRRRKTILYPLLSLAVIVTVVAIIEAGVLRFRATFEDAFVVMVGIGIYTVFVTLFRRPETA
jgi:hypothetical protein